MRRERYLDASGQVFFFFFVFFFFVSNGVRKIFFLGFFLKYG